MAAEYSAWSFTSVSNPPGSECKADVRWCCPQFYRGRDGLAVKAWGLGGALRSLAPVTLLAPRGPPWAPTFLSGGRQVTVHLHRARHVRYSEEFMVPLCQAKQSPFVGEVDRICAPV